MTREYPVIEFHQFGSDTAEDKILLFAPKAKDLAAWAGIPRKGWRIRMLFQRWITQGRQDELKEFWTRAAKLSSPPSPHYILGPSAIVIAIQGEPTITNGKIQLDYTSPVEGMHSIADKVQQLAEIVSEKVFDRLIEEDQVAVRAFQSDPLVAELPDPSHNYVLEFAYQLEQMKKDPEWFISHNKIEDIEARDLVTSMEALCRPAIVVDGQHRLWGAQAVAADIYLPVVAITRSDWTHQIYQFVVINEKAQKVDSELLNDIFASSLTPREQNTMRDGFTRVKVDIEQRIAGVIAGRKPESPFYQMVTINLPNPPASEATAYISQIIIQSLIEGGRGAWGWRSNDAFYDAFVQPTFSDRAEWEHWKDGKWQEYWFAFWHATRDVFVPAAKKLKGADYELWDKTRISNLTKGVGLKIFQRFFMETMIDRMETAVKGFEILEKHMGKEGAEKAIADEVRKAAIPADVEDFKKLVKEEFLEKFPVRFFTTPWESSLDDSSGQEDLLVQMRLAFTKKGWRAEGKGVFTTEDATR
jgi:hypothetical protein